MKSREEFYAQLAAIESEAGITWRPELYYGPPCPKFPIKHRRRHQDTSGFKIQYRHGEAQPQPSVLSGAGYKLW